MTTLNQIVKLFEDIASNHNQINGFGFGDLWEYSAANDGLTKNKKPMIMWAVLNGSSVTAMESRLNFSLLFMDLVKKDEDNETEVLSDTLQVAQDVLAILHHKNYYGNFFVLKESALEDFTERFDDEMAGWKMDITLRIPYEWDSCSPPMTSIPTIKGTITTN